MNFVIQLADVHWKKKCKRPKTLKFKWGYKFSIGWEIALFVVSADPETLIRRNVFCWRPPPILFFFVTHFYIGEYLNFLTFYFAKKAYPRESEAVKKVKQWEK